MDMLYKEFVVKDLQRQQREQPQRNSGMSIKEKKKKPFVKRKKFRWLMIGGAAVVLLVSAAIGAYFIWASMQVINPPIGEPTPNTTPSPVPVEAPTSIQIPIAVPVSDPGPPANVDVYARERNALEDFYYATGGPGWLAAANWMTNVSVCNWQGIDCDVDSRVTSLQFTEQNNMTGTLPETLGDLELLTHLNFAQSDIGGTIPNIFGRLAKLQNLILGNNKFEGSFPMEIFNLTELQIVFVQGNFFDPWMLPDWISNATSLVNLNLIRCNLIGKVPPNLGKMTNLLSVSIVNNTLDGFLPSFEFATKLTSLLFYNTSLIGEIPAIPPSLRALRLPFNSLTAGIERLPSSWEGDWLDLQSNDFSGNFGIAENILMFLSTLDISYNNFNSVPAYTAPIDIGSCAITGNNFTCPLPMWIRYCSGAPLCT
jgi:hypothetical protein